MDKDRFQKAERLFHEVMDLKPSLRAAHIEEAAEGDAELSAHVKRLVEFAAASSPLVAMLEQEGGLGGADLNAAPRSPTGFAPDDVEDRSSQIVGAAVGPYTIVDLVGEGGFGAVYRAQQESPVRRTVAMKLLKPGMDSRQVVARFEAERQALALMEHPNIARVFDAGHTDSALGSRPYFVMEFVAGQSITDYCGHHELDWRARLELFITVCLAVQHAHQKGIIHRDLKPSNIIVTMLDGAPVPKVIDFGIAKALEPGHRLTSQTLMTQRLELLGTPQYMSPEQAAGDGAAIDTRSDIFSLGAILYELLTGATPVEDDQLHNASYTQIQRLIQEQTVERPSARIKRVGREAGGRAPLTRLRAELDWVVLKALDHDRDQRYSSAAAFADDLRRFLNHEPVLAGPPRAMYRARKFIRRHRIGVAASALVVLAILVGTIGTAVGMIRARAAAERERLAAAEAVQINQFMSDVLTSVDPDRGEGADMRLVDILQRASATAAQRFEGFPLLEVQVRDLLGRAYHKLALWSASTAEYERRMVLLESVAGPDDARSLSARLAYLRALANEGRIVEREAGIQGLPQRIERVLGPQHELWFEAQRLSAQHLYQRRRHKEAAELLQQLADQARAANVSEGLQMQILRGLVLTQWRLLENSSGPERERLREAAEAQAQKVYQWHLAQLGREAVATLESHLVLAELACERSDYAFAGAIARAVLKTSEQRLGDCHELRTRAYAIAARADLVQGDAAGAADIMLHRIECQRTVNPIAWISTMSDAIPILDRGGKWSEGERVARELAERLKEFGGGHGPMVLDAQIAEAHFLSRQGRADEAADLFASLLAREDEAREDISTLARLHMYYGAHLAARGDFSAAEHHLLIAVEAIGDVRKGTRGFFRDDLIFELLQLYRVWNKPDKVAEYERLRAEIAHPYS
jgi:serine/threonine protein kinase